MRLPSMLASVVLSCAAAGHALAQVPVVTTRPACRRALS